MIDYLTKDNTYYSDLRGVYINYDFTAEQVQGVIANIRLSTRLPSILLFLLKALRRATFGLPTLRLL